MVLILAALPCIWCFVGLKMRWSVLSGKVIAGSANTGLRFVRPADTCTGRKPVRFPCNTAVELASAYFPDGKTSRLMERLRLIVCSLIGRIQAGCMGIYVGSLVLVSSQSGCRVIGHRLLAWSGRARMSRSQTACFNHL